MLKNNLKLFLNSNPFKFILLSLFLLNGIASLYYSGVFNDYVNALLNTFLNSFYILFLTCILSFSNFQMLEYIDKNKFETIRLKTKQRYLNYQIKVVILVSFLVFLVNLMIVLILFNVFIGLDFETFFSESFLYLFFIILRTFFLLVNIQVFGLYLSKVVSKFVGSFFPFFFVLPSYFFLPDYTIVISKFSQMKWTIWSYFQSYSYSSFRLEVLFSLFFVIVIMLVNLLSSFFVYKRIKAVGD